ncbi:MAG: DUF5655 domain-containing protein [Myxococcota bacterium]
MELCLQHLTAPTELHAAQPREGHLPLLNVVAVRITLRAMKFQSPADKDAAHRFFADRPLAQSLFEELAAFVDTLGPTLVTSTKSRVAFLAKTRFLWVHEATAEGIWLGFLHPRHVASPRLRSGPVGKRWSHHTKLTTSPDAELKRWITEAYRADTATTSTSPGPRAKAAARKSR